MPLILTVPRTCTPTLPLEGCWPVADWGFLAHASWLERAQAEHDERYLQLIPYLLLHDASGQLWCYQRSGGDARLQGRCSCGVGGHVDAEDALADDAGGAANASGAGTSCSAVDSSQCMSDLRSKPISLDAVQATLQRALLRELAEELGAHATDLADLHLHGLIFEGHTPVGRVHLGVLYSARWLPAAAPQPPAHEALRSLGWRAAPAVAADPAFERWSQLSAAHWASEAPHTSAGAIPTRLA